MITFESFLNMFFELLDSGVSFKDVEYEVTMYYRELMGKVDSADYAIIRLEYIMYRLWIGGITEKLLQAHINELEYTGMIESN